jgi:hypothetical protein
VRLGETGIIAAGESAEFEIIAPEGGSTIFFRCQIHPSRMSGTITVE